MHEYTKNCDEAQCKIYESFGRTLTSQSFTIIYPFLVTCLLNNQQEFVQHAHSVRRKWIPYKTSPPTSKIVFLLINL